MHAFEPLAQHTSKFRASVTEIPSAILHEVALGAESVSAKMRVNDQHSRVGGNRSPIWSMSTVGEILLRGLDQYVARFRVPLPDLIKADVQGFELEVLRSGLRYLRAPWRLAWEFYRGQGQFTR
jgi:FkbM family methyltransferase